LDPKLVVEFLQLSDGVLVIFRHVQRRFHQYT
jgi:hypothetical protein